MTISFSAAAKAPASAVVVLGVHADRADSRPADLDWVAIEARGFEAKLAQHAARDAALFSAPRGNG